LVLLGKNNGEGMRRAWGETDQGRLRSFEGKGGIRTTLVITGRSRQVKKRVSGRRNRTKRGRPKVDEKREERALLSSQQGEKTVKNDRGEKR